MPQLFQTINSEQEVKEQEAERVFPSVPMVAPETQSIEQQNITATLATMADLKNTSSLVPVQNLLDRNKQLIAQGQENLLRSKHEAARKRNMISASRSLQAEALQNAEGSAELFQTFAEFELATEQAEMSHALEMEAIEHIQNLTAEDPFQAQLFIDQLREGDTLNRMRDNAVKITIWNQELDKLATEHEDQPFIRDFFDFLFLPGQSLFAVTGAVPGGKDLGLFTLPGTNLEKESRTLFDTPVDEFAAVARTTIQNLRDNSGLFAENLTLTRQAAEQLYGVSDSDKLEFSLWTGVEAVAVADILVPLARAMRSPIRLAQLLGNRSGAANLATQRIAAEAADITDSSGLAGMTTGADAVEASLPSSLVPDTARTLNPTVGLHGDIATKLGALQDAAKAIDDIIVPDRMSAAQLQEAVQSQVKGMEGRFKEVSDRIVDYKQVVGEGQAAGTGSPFQELVHVSVDPTSGVRQLNVLIGRNSGTGGYRSEAAAKGGATRLGFAPKDTDFIRGADGQWYIKRKENVTETGVATPELAEADFPSVGVLSQYIRSPDNFSPELFSELRLTSTLNEAKIQKEVVAPIEDALGALSNKETKILSKVLAIGQRDAEWFDINTLNAHYQRIAGRPATEKEIIGYAASKELNDIDHRIRVLKVWTNKARSGFETVQIKDDVMGFDTLRVNGKEIPNPDFNALRVLDVEDGRHLAPGEATDDLIRKFETGQYEVWLLENSPARWKNDPIRHALVKKQSRTRGPLEREQVGYSGGGHRIYNTKFFVKQANRGRFADGQEYLLNPMTHITAKTEIAAKRWADSMESARKAFVELEAGRITRTQAADIVDQSPVEDLDKFIELVNKFRKGESGGVNPNDPFEVLFDQTLPKAYDGPGAAVRFVDEHFTGQDQWLNTTGRMYYSRKGEHLKSPHEEFAETLDPLKTLSRGLQNAIRTRAFSDYETRAVEEWVRIASPYIDETIPAGASDSFIFHRGELKESFKADNFRLFNALTANRNVIKRFMNLQTPEQAASQQALRRFAGWVEGKGKFGEALAGSAMDVHSKNPVNAVRGAVFDAYLGFYDVGQLFLQTQAFFSAATVHPVRGGRAAMMVWPMRQYLRNPSENLLDYYATRLKDIHGMEVSDFKQMMKSYRQSGWNNPDGAIVQLDHHTSTIGSGIARRQLEKVRKKGRFFFYAAERMNRMTGYQLAYREILEQFPKLKPGSKEFIMKVNQRTSDWTQNMTKASAAAWQKGVFSIPTQFRSFQARMLENILPKSFGGNPRFSKAQKWKLGLGQALLYGTGGVPIADQLFDYMKDEWEKNNGEPLNDEMVRIVTKGFWDSLFFGIGGDDLDTDFSERAGQAKAWADVFNAMSGGESFYDVATGPAGSFGSSVGRSYQRIVNHFLATKAAPGVEDWKLIANDVLSNISSWKRGSKAALIWRMGHVKDPKTGQVITDASALEGFAAALGIQLREETERFDLLEDIGTRKEEIQDVARTIAMDRRSFFDALIAGDEQKADFFERRIQGTLGWYQDDILLQQQIMQEATRQLGWTEKQIDSVRRRYEETLGRQAPGSAQ